jgi:hypothetical protein
MYPRMRRGPTYQLYSPRRVYNRSGWSRQPVPRAMPSFRAPIPAFHPYRRYQYNKPIHKPVSKPVKKAPLRQRGPEHQAYRHGYRKYQRAAYAPGWYMARYQYYPRHGYRGRMQNKPYQRISKSMMHKRLIANRLRVPHS